MNFENLRAFERISNLRASKKFRKINLRALLEL